MKKAFIAYVSYAVRVVVDDKDKDCIEQEEAVIKAAKEKFRTNTAQYVDEFGDNVEDVFEDTECPYEETLEDFIGDIFTPEQ